MHDYKNETLPSKTHNWVLKSNLKIVNRSEQTCNKRKRTGQGSMWKVRQRHLRGGITNQSNYGTPLHTSSDMAETLSTDSIKCWWGSGTRALLRSRGGSKWDSHFLRQFGTFLTNLNTVPPYAPTIMLLGICQNELKNVVHTYTRTHTHKKTVCKCL